MSSEKKYMRLAIRKAREGIRKGQSPFGACLVKDGRVIACAHNMAWKTQDITAHAEVTAIRQACKKLRTIDLSGGVIYSTCEPCPMCFAACHWARITKIFFGARIADAKRQGFRELCISTHRLKRLGKSSIQVKGDLLRRENVALFRSFARRRDKKVY